jgi:hypothetical protein
MGGVRLQPGDETPAVVRDLIFRLRGYPTADLHHHHCLRQWSTGRRLGTWRIIEYLVAAAGGRLMIVDDPDAPRRAAEYQPPPRGGD